MLQLLQPAHFFPAPNPHALSPRANISQELELFRNVQDPAVTAARIQQVCMAAAATVSDLHWFIRFALLILQ